nr:uncharacterized protein LOC111508426 isoform X3 [Leptinotarsa decemlineata]
MKIFFKDRKKRRMWELSIEKVLPPTSSICSQHFPPDCLGKTKIKKGGLPNKKYSPRTPILSDDLEISEPSQGKPFASKGGYQYEMLKKSSNNFITWVCVKRETEQCHGRLTSKFGFVMKEFPHSCREDTVINLMEHCANIETEISKGNGDIPIELISGNASPEKEFNLVKQEQSSSEIEMDSFTSVKQDIGVNVKNKLKRQRTEISSKHSLSHPVEFDPSLRRLSEDVLSPEPEKSSDHSENVICRLCLESSNRNEATPLSLPDKNCSEETSGSKKIRAMQTAMFANMLQILMPHFDLGMACNPVMCPKCKTLLLSAYNFVETCTNNENVIYLYKSKYASDGKKVFCEDVVKSLPALLNEDDSPNKKLKMMELESDITESQEQILSSTIQDCTEIEPTCPSPVKQENIENVEKYSSPSTESLAIVEEKIIAEDFSDDFIDISVSEHISSVLKMRSLQKKQSSPDNCGTIKVDKPPKNSTKTHFCDKSFQVTNISAPSYNIVEPTKKSDYDINLT